MSSEGVPLIGIVGGVGSGKSTLANALSRHLRSVRLDADSAGHEALADEGIQQALRSAFGEGIFDSEGRVSRPAVAARVFGSSGEHRSARATLEQIVHPHIRRQLTEKIEQLRRTGEYDVLVLDAALMLEAGWGELCDAIIFVDVPREQRLQRVASRGWSEQELDNREASQMPLHEKQARADFIVDNSQNLESAANELAEWIRTRFDLTAAKPATPQSN